MPMMGKFFMENRRQEMKKGKEKKKKPFSTSEKLLEELFLRN